MAEILWLLPIGLCVGLIGSLIGVGGGFFVVPYLLLARDFSPTGATAASLGMVLLTALSATAGNARRRRIDYRAGLVFAAATLPGAWAGRLLVETFSPRAFAAVFAALLALLAVYLVAARAPEGRGVIRGTPRRVVDAQGQEYRYEVHFLLGFLLSLLIGVLSSLFGVGGGLIHVPLMVLLFGMPTRVATSTSQFVLVFTSAAGLAEALRRGQMPAEGLRLILTMGLGMALGAQAGVAAAERVRAKWVRWILAGVLLSVAVHMFLNSGECAV